MTDIFKLDSRLLACADFVRNGVNIADIGTDHAYLPIWLVKKGIIKNAVAADIREMPLQRGEENIIKYGCEDRIKTKLSDGLDEISPYEADDIIMAGMGAELICNIISRAEWLKNSEKHLIMQPMTRAHILRKYLADNGFKLLDEKACTHAGKSYTVILAEYCGKVIAHDELFYYCGSLHGNSQADKEYIKQILKKLGYKAKGRQHEGKSSDDLESLINEIKIKFGVDTVDLC